MTRKLLVAGFLIALASGASRLPLPTLHNSGPCTANLCNLCAAEGLVCSTSGACRCVKP